MGIAHGTSQYLCVILVLYAIVAESNLVYGVAEVAKDASKGPAEAKVQLVII